jgi:DNA-binding transcriptional regulator YiaG
MNIAQVLKLEISRISKHEAKLLTSTTRSTAIQLKKTTADLKNRLATLEKSNKELIKQVEFLVTAIPKPVQEAEVKGWISGKGVKYLRKKLGLTQEELGKLTGVSLGGVRAWERQAGMLKMRETTKKAIMAIRGIGKVEARKRLDELGETITLDKGVINPYLKVAKKAKVVAKKRHKKAGLKRRK